MKIKKAFLFALAFASFSAQAIDISGYFTEHDPKMNASSYKLSSYQEDKDFCSKTLEPICKGKNCKAEQTIQEYMNKSCESNIQDKSLLVGSAKRPMGPPSFSPESYAGFSVFLSRFAEFITLVPYTSEGEYEIYKNQFNKVKEKYIEFDNNNISNAFKFTGSYLEHKSSRNKPMFPVAHSWATSVMQERDTIDKQFSALNNALESLDSFLLYRQYKFNLLPTITSELAFDLYKESKFSPSECKTIFLNLSEDYLSELYKQTQFECSN